MKKIVIYCFDAWWRPVLFFGIMVPLKMIWEGWQLQVLMPILNVLSMISVFAFLFSLVYQLYKKRFAEGAIYFFVWMVVGCTHDLQVLVDGDHWDDTLQIPLGISIDTPLGEYTLNHRRSGVRLPKTQPDLVLYRSYQQGVYTYDFYVGKMESGFIYLKAFEVTHGDALSAKSLAKNTEVWVGNISDTIVRFSPGKPFKIYEGDWGKFYAARFEVWFRPVEGGEERKLFQKNFKIEGWMH